MTAIIDYGVGNLFSLRSSFEFIGEEVCVTSDKDVIASADRLVLPGVGAFPDAAERLKESCMDSLVKELARKGMPLLGICLGMQLLLDKSLEFGEHEGLGLIKGTVRPIAEVIDEGLKIPQIGWNALEFKGEKSPLFKYIKNGDHVYFVHSFYADAEPEYITAVTEYSAPLTAAVGCGNVFGCQFHPEKSSTVGLQILKGFCEMKG